MFSLRCYFHLISLPTAKDKYSGHDKIQYCFAYGGITLYAIMFQKTSAAFLDRNIITEHHISAMLPQQIQFGLFPFRSPLLGISQLISLPHGTKMLQFPWFDHRPCGRCVCKYRIPIRRSRDHRTRAPTPGLSQLATSFISSQA